MKNSDKYYLIEPRTSSLFVDESTLVIAKNSKQAIEKTFNVKVKRSIFYYNDFDFIAFCSNEKGQIYRDKRKKIFYKKVN